MELKKHIHYTYDPVRDRFIISGSVLRQMFETIAENAREDLRRKMAVTTEKA